MKSILLHFVTSQHYSLIGDWSMTNQWSCCFSSVPQLTILTITVEESGDDPCIDVKLGQELDDDLPSVSSISIPDNNKGRQHARVKTDQGAKSEIRLSTISDC